MEENDKRFRFLSDDEYTNLTPDARLPYLRAASQELERRQEQIRALMQELMKENRIP